MLLYYHSWMFYNHFIVILYHFLVLTYWHSAKCQLLFSACFLHRRKSISNAVQMQRNFTEIFLDQKERNGPWLCLGESRGGDNPPGCARRPKLALVGCAHLGCPRTASLLYKSTKYWSSRRRVQKHQIQSRHHHRAVHHVHWCLSDDAWVVLCRPTGP